MRLLSGGEVTLEPAYLHDTVVPMASAIGPSAPVFVVDARERGTLAFAPINQGPGETAWFGRDTPAAIARLQFLRDVAGPMLRLVLDASGPIDLFSLAAQGVQVGDDVHMRTQGTTSLLIRNLLPQLAALPDDGRSALAQFLSGNHLFFLNLAMAAAKSVAMWAEQVPGSSIVTMMCRNGTSYGIRVAGSAEVFVSDAPPVADAMYYPDYGPETSAGDIGDSAILELVGLGGAAAAGSPAVAGFLGGGLADAGAMTDAMTSICAGQSTRFKLPFSGYRGTPVGVDVRRVVELNTTPKVTTGILHATSGIGQIGAGVATAPIECFRAALRLFGRERAGERVGAHVEGPHRQHPVGRRYASGHRRRWVRDRGRRAGGLGWDRYRAAADRPVPGLAVILFHPVTGVGCEAARHRTQLGSGSAPSASTRA